MKADGSIKSIVIFFSRADENYYGGRKKYLKVGNTEIVANSIKNLVGADMFKVERKEPYPEDYTEVITLAKEEIKNNLRPEIKSYLPTISDYDVIFIGSPIYWDTMPACMFTLLETLDFREKVVMPFTTHEGSGLGSVVSDLKKICKGGVVKEGLAIYGPNAKKSNKEIKEWIRENTKYVIL